MKLLSLINVQIAEKHKMSILSNNEDLLKFYIKQSATFYSAANGIIEHLKAPSMQLFR